jgi:hypothetical protein
MKKRTAKVGFGTSTATFRKSSSVKSVTLVNLTSPPEKKKCNPGVN